MQLGVSVDGAAVVGIADGTSVGRDEVGLKVGNLVVGLGLGSRLGLTVGLVLGDDEGEWVGK